MIPSVGDGEIEETVAVEIMQNDRTRLFRYSYCHRIAEAPVPVSEEDGQGVAANVCCNEIRQAIAVDVSRDDAGRIFPDHISMVKIKQVRYLMGVPLATSEAGKEKGVDKESPHAGQGHAHGWSHCTGSFPMAQLTGELAGGCLRCLPP